MKTYLGTELLFYKNNKQFSFTATVLACSLTESGYGIRLNRTAFFFEGGGQRADEGTLDGQRVRDVKQTPEGLLHYVDNPIEVGKKVKGKLDSAIRLARMCNHSGEHILSAAVYRRFGYSNVGFHMSEHSMDVDFNGEFTSEELAELESEVNRVVRLNLPVLTYYPSADKLAKLQYRSKLQLEAPRIVEIKGYDRCACCAPHVSFTGEIGYVKITDSYRNRTNTRLTLLCGADAVDYISKEFLSCSAAAVMLSAKPLNIGEAVAKQCETLQRERAENSELRSAVAKLQIENLQPTNGYMCIFCQEFSAKKLLNAALEYAPKGACVFYPSRGGYSYSFASTVGDLRPVCAELNTRFKGRGGGKPLAVQGAVLGSKEQLEVFFRELNQRT